MDRSDCGSRCLLPRCYLSARSRDVLKRKSLFEFNMCLFVKEHLTIAGILDIQHVIHVCVYVRACMSGAYVCACVRVYVRVRACKRARISN